MPATSAVSAQPATAASTAAPTNRSSSGPSDGDGKISAAPATYRTVRTGLDGPVARARTGPVSRAARTQYAMNGAQSTTGVTLEACHLRPAGAPFSCEVT